MIQLYISRASPYSSKAHALLGYSGLPHQVVVQNLVTRYSVLRRMTGKTLVPTLRNGDFAINDSSKIARHLVPLSQRPLLLQEEAVVSWLIEDFADEWMVRWLVQPRWTDPQNIAHLNQIIGGELAPGPAQNLIGRLGGVAIQAQLRGSGLLEPNPEISSSRDRTLATLETLFTPTPYIFGGAPTVPDFALYGMLWQFFNDPTGQPLQSAFPHVWAFCQRVHVWTQEGEGTSTSEVRDLVTLQPLVAEILATHWRVLVDNFRQTHPRKCVVNLGTGQPMPYLSSKWLVGCGAAILDEAEHALTHYGRLSGDPTLNHGLLAALTHEDMPAEVVDARPNLKKSKTASF